MTVKTIQDINDKYDYDDTENGGSNDASLVSCGQCENYNELQYIYDSKLKPHVAAGNFTKQEAIDALDDACKKLSNPRSRVKFYKHLSDKLGVLIE